MYILLCTTFYYYYFILFIIHTNQLLRQRNLTKTNRGIGKIRFSSVGDTF